MDQTKLFLATVKAVRLQNKCPVNKSVKRKSEFSESAKNVHSSIRKLRDFLLMCRKDYIDSSGFLVANSTMNDDERDRIDCEVEEIIQVCTENIKKVRKLLDADHELSCGSQLRRHRTFICESLGEDLRNTCKMYSEQKAVRIKRTIDKRKNYRLQSYKKSLLKDTELKDTEKDGTVINSVKEFIDDSNDTSTENPQFAAENEQLFTEMSSMTSELRQIEGKVIEISRLQEVFANNVLIQANQLDDIEEVIVQASENVQLGNQKLREAIKNKGTLRIWILFILVVLSIALLFLEWYS